MENNKKEEKLEIYGPDIVRETSTQFYFRKMKREGLYCKKNIIILVLLFFSVPTISYSILHHFTTNTFFSFPKAITEASLILFTFTSIYSFTISYLCYVPKESIEESIKHDIEELKFLRNYKL